MDGEIARDPAPDGSGIEIVEFEEANGDREFIEAKIRELAGDPDIISAEPNSLVELHYRPNDTFFANPQGIANQNYLSITGMPAAWNQSRGNGAGIGIADTGLPRTPYGELPAVKVLAQTDKLYGDSVADDYSGHGSAVAAVAAARTDNGYGMAGAGFNAKVAMCKSATKLSNGTHFGTKGALIQCIDWLQKRSGVNVLNLSTALPDGDASPAMTREIRETQEVYGKVIIASVGNDGEYKSTKLPASLPGVIGVGSNDNRTTRSSFSNYGPLVDVMAPGNGIVTYVVDNEKPARSQGTSFSAPQVAGCAALLSAKGYSAAQVRSRILRNDTDMGPVGRDNATGYGYLNCGKAFSN